MVLTEAEVRRLVVEAPREGAQFGLFVETAAITGARPSQLARILVRDLKKNQIEMPSSRKGRGKKKITRRQIPIPATLATRLGEAADRRPQDVPLLTKSSGEPWKKGDHTRLFRRTAKRARLDPEIVTIYALRHSSITRQLKAGVPIRADCGASRYVRRDDRKILLRRDRQTRRRDRPSRIARHGAGLRHRARCEDRKSIGSALTRCAAKKQRNLNPRSTRTLPY